MKKKVDQMEKMLEIIVESHLVSQKAVDEKLQRYNECLKFEHFRADFKAELVKKIKEIEQLKVGSRIWTISFVEQLFSKEHFFESVYKKGYGFHGMEKVSFTMTENNDKWDVDSNLTDHVIPFFNKRGKILNVYKLIDFVLKLSKTEKSDEQNLWNKDSFNDDEFLCVDSEIDNDGNFIIKRGANIVEKLNIYDSPSKFEVSIDDNLDNEIVVSLLKKVAENLRK